MAGYLPCHRKSISDPYHHGTARSASVPEVSRGFPEVNLWNTSGKPLAWVLRKLWQQPQLNIYFANLFTKNAPPVPSNLFTKNAPPVPTPCQVLARIRAKPARLGLCRTYVKTQTSGRYLVDTCKQKSQGFHLSSTQAGTSDPRRSTGEFRR